MSGDQDLQSLALSTPPPSNAAQTAVFQTLELLELILSNLPFPSLAACQNLNRHFSLSIRNSSLLCLTLSRETVQTETLRYLPTPGGAFGYSLGPEITSRKLCPLLSFKGPKRLWRLPPDCFPEVPARLDIEEYLADEACWGNVYLTNPPVAEAWICILWRVDSEEWEGSYAESLRVVAEDGRGLTIGGLYEGLLKQRRWTASCGASRKGVPWSPGSYMCARADTVAESIARLEELTGCKAEVAKGSCVVYFPRMVGAVRR
jgi:hypothetical protein